MADPSTMTPEKATPELVKRIERFFTEACWMTDREIAGKARLLLREAADALEASEPSKSTKASDVLGWMDSEGPVTRAQEKPVER